MESPASKTDRLDTSKPPPKGLLLPYQRDFLADSATGIIWEKSRQIGGTFTLTLKAVAETLQSKRPLESVYGSASARQVYKAGREMRKHLKVFKAATDDIIRDEKANTEQIVFPRDRIINLVPSNPDTIAGFSGNVYLDEFALHKDDRGIWKAVFPTITRGYKIRIISTHRGKKTIFYGQVNNPVYSRHRTTIRDAVAQGLILKSEDGNIITPDMLRKLLNEDEIWLEEYMVEAQDEASSWLTHALIAGIEEEGLDPRPEWSRALIEDAIEAARYYRVNKREPDWWFERSRNHTAVLYDVEGPIDLGMDIGRTRDLSVIWLLKRGAIYRPTLAVLELNKQPFRVQRLVLNALLDFVIHTRGRACIDRSGLGTQLSEEAEDLYGSHVEGIDFNNTNKEALAIGLKDAVQDMVPQIPKDETIRRSLHSIKKTLTPTGKNRYDAERTEKTGHADHFWALALAVHAGDTFKETFAIKPIVMKSL
jgi:phage FluMu gp28-like protein